MSAVVVPASCRLQLSNCSEAGKYALHPRSQVLWTVLLRLQLTALAPVQVLGEVFASLHRAQLGPSADSEPDVQLPQRIRVPHGQQALRPPQSTLTATLVLAMFGQAVQVTACLLQLLL